MNYTVLSSDSDHQPTLKRPSARMCYHHDLPYLDVGLQHLRQALAAAVRLPELVNADANFAAASVVVLDVVRMEQVTIGKVRCSSYNEVGSLHYHSYSLVMSKGYVAPSSKG